MAIKYYEDEPRKDGYKGIRVSCTLGGKHIQEYFHQSQRAEAEARHAELMKQVAHRGSKTAQQYAYSAPRYDPPRRTGVVWRDYKRVPSGWYALCPSVEEFKKLRRFYNKQGENILLSNLDVMIHEES